jgi:ammonia channel protein AmtB
MYSIANVPGFGRLIDGIQRKKSYEQIIIAVVIGVLLCFTIWWVFLR